MSDSTKFLAVSTVAQIASSSENLESLTHIESVDASIRAFYLDIPLQRRIRIYFISLLSCAMKESKQHSSSATSFRFRLMHFLAACLLLISFLSFLVAILLWVENLLRVWRAKSVEQKFPAQCSRWTKLPVAIISEIGSAFAYIICPIRLSLSNRIVSTSREFVKPFRC